MPTDPDHVSSVIECFGILHQNQDDDLAAEMLADTFFWMRDEAPKESIHQVVEYLDDHIALLVTAVNMLTPEELDPLWECLEEHYPDNWPALEWAVDASESLDMHLASDFRAWKRRLCFVVDASNKDKSADRNTLIRLLFWSPAEPGAPVMMAVETPVLWDEGRFALSSVALTVLRTSWLVDSIEVQSRKPAPAWAPTPLFRLHPERFKQSRSYAEERVTLWRQADDPVEAMNAGMGLVSNAYNAALSEHPLRSRVTERTPGMILLQAEEHLGHFYIQYRLNGSQVFEIPASLTSMLRNTSADDVPLPLLVSPYPAYFLHLGVQSDLDLGNGWLVDGCYVEHHAENFLQFCFTAQPPEPELIRQWPVIPEPHEVQSFGGERLTYDVGTAVDLLISDLKARLHNEQRGDGTFERGMDEFKKTFPDNPLASLIGSGTRERATVQEAMMDRTLPVVRKALDLVINTICYLTAYPDDVDTRYAEEAPKKLVKQANTGAPRAASRAQSKLEKLGFVPVHFAGQNAKRRPVVRDDNTASDDRTVRQHWRRGHWRRTPYGPGREHRRLKWIMPTLVRRDAPDTHDPAGHLYIVDSAPESS